MESSSTTWDSLGHQTEVVGVPSPVCSTHAWNGSTEWFDQRYSFGSTKKHTSTLSSPEHALGGGQIIYIYI